MDRRSLLLGSAASAAYAPIASAANGSMLFFASGGQQPSKYPNFPRTQIWSLRSSSDIDSVPSGVSNITDTPTGGGVRFQLGTTMKVIGHTFASPVDMRNGNIRIWVRFPSGTTTIGNWRFIMGSSGSPPTGTGTPANYVSCLNSYSTAGISYWLNNTWQEIAYSTNSAALFLGGTVDLSAITWICFQGACTSGTLNIDFTDWAFQPNPRTKAAVIFRFDDANPQGYANLYSTLHAAGFNGPMFNGGAVASAQGFDQAGRVTTAQANEMRAAGAQFMSQAWTTENVPGSGTSSDFDAQFAGMKAWTAQKNWMDGYADGSFYTSVSPTNQTARVSMVRSGIRTIQRFDNGSAVNPPIAPVTTFPFADETNIPALNIASPGGGGTAIRTYVGYQLTATKARNGVLILGGHTEWSDANVQNAVSDVIADAQAGNIEIHTMNTLLDPWLKKYGPAPSRY